jgi:hypothetical protein
VLRLGSIHSPPFGGDPHRASGLGSNDQRQCRSDLLCEPHPSQEQEQPPVTSGLASDRRQPSLLLMVAITFANPLESSAVGSRANDNSKFATPFSSGTWTGFESLPISLGQDPSRSPLPEGYPSYLRAIVRYCRTGADEGFPHFTSIAFYCSQTFRRAVE